MFCLLFTCVCILIFVVGVCGENPRNECRPAWFCVVFVGVCKVKGTGQLISTFVCVYAYVHGVLICVCR